MGLDVPSRIGHGPWEPLLPLLQQIAAQVTGVQQVIVVPHADTHSLPWGALAALAGWQVPVTTVPALGLLARLQEREPSQGSDALVVGNPNGKYTSGKPDLPFAVYEAKNVANTLGVSAICEENATKKAVLTGLRNARIAHFACHAEFSPDDPFDSGIILADGKLTAREIMQSGERVPEFVALSACTTGNVNPVAGDELAGLSQAFLYSGAKAVLVSLWPVDDSATVALMKAFYGKWCNRGTDKATALYQAMATTRRVEEWSDLYYWGGFILVGDGR